MRSFEGNHIDLLFENQDIRIGIFMNLFNLNCSYLKYKQSDSIKFNANIPLKIFFYK